jgi:hypothetical protein
MSWNFSNIFGGAAGGAGAGASFGPWGAAIGGVLGGLAGGLSGGGSSKSETETKRTSTPVRVRLKSGAVVTMYAHGPGSSTTTQSGPKPSALETAGDVLMAGGLWKKYTQKDGAGGGTPDWFSKLTGGGTDPVVGKKQTGDFSDSYV